MATQPFNPLDFLGVGRELAASHEEAKLRTAVGRAYYSVFLGARDKAGVRGRRDVHAQVIRAVRRRSGFRAAGDKLDSLRRLRIVADYELLPQRPSDRDWHANWQIAERLANDILSKLKAW
jgi:hypothetical protein